MRVNLHYPGLIQISDRCIVNVSRSGSSGRAVKDSREPKRGGRRKVNRDTLFRSVYAVTLFEVVCLRSFSDATLHCFRFTNLQHLQESLENEMIKLERRRNEEEVLLCANLRSCLHLFPSLALPIFYTVP